MQKSKVYIISGLSIAASIGLYFLITKKKKVEPSPIPKVDASGKEIAPEQSAIPQSVAALMNLNLTGANKAMVGKKIYTKIADVNARLNPQVNNGVLNNLIGTIFNKGTYVGVVTKVEEDNGGARNGNRKFKWVQILKPSEAVVSDLEVNRPIYLREDVIDFQK